jgi:hypothetical protein
MNIDAGHRGGDARNRVEGLVMGLDRRGVVIRLQSVGSHHPAIGFKESVYEQKTAKASSRLKTGV